MTPQEPTKLEAPSPETAPLKQGTDLAKLAELEKELTEAASTTPAVVREALSPKTIKLAELVLHTYTVQTHLNLLELDSPFVNGKGATPTFRDVIQVLFALITPDEEIEKLLAGDPRIFREACAKFASSLDMTEFIAATKTITEAVTRPFAAAAKLNPPNQEGGGSPLDETSSATEPAGS
jgi:hypothetical protein